MLILKNISISIIAIYLLVLSFLPSMHAQELAKIPILIQHYQEHKQQSTSPIGIIEFLNLHYNDSNHDAQDPHEDLPFHQLLKTPFTFISNEISAFNFSIATPLVEFTENYIIAHYLSPQLSIFQPPKL